MLGFTMHPLTVSETITEIARRLDAGFFTQHAVVNVAKIVYMQRDTALAKAVMGCDIINIDGMGIVWGGRFLGYVIPERVAGIDLFFKLLELAERRGEPVFLLGSRPDVLGRSISNLRNIYPKLNIVGSHHGYFWDDEESIVKSIRSSGASMLFVAITSPKKEQFIHQWRNQLGVKFAMGVGGTFDIIAGLTKRAPLWMQRFGMEWVYRLIQEPRRMWKRYLGTNFRFLWLILKEKLLQLRAS